MSLTETIKHEARNLGFDAVGIAAVEPVTTQTLSDRLQQWIARQYHGTMAWMSREPARRADPAVVLPGCRSIVSLGMSYGSGLQPDEKPGKGRVARYAWGKDYHIVLRERLSQLEEHMKILAPDAATKSYVDTGPVMEKAWAQQAGLGWIGKHSNLVSADHGSWLVLGEILTTLNLVPDEPATDLCGSCRLCIQACPTDAIVEPYVVDARRCISYLTIEYRGSADTIPEDLRAGMGNRIFGCDDCLDACPFNLQASTPLKAAFSPRDMTRAPVLEQLAHLSEREFAELFQESPIRRSKWSGLRRNVGIAQQNEATRRNTRPAPFHP